MPPIKKIVVIGPESTGKSTLCAALAQHYHTDWVPEFAREYLLKHGTKYQFADLDRIARGQVEMEDRIASSAGGRFLFIDTDLYVMKVWCEYVFGKCHPWILDQITIRSYDLYLLCNTDLPWTRDELREYPDLENRNKLFRIYKDLLVNQHTPWVEIGGQDDRRLQQGIRTVESYFPRKK
jgi:NadR type nicotinamide-nucleotide adenylyltransferase